MSRSLPLRARLLFDKAGRLICARASACAPVAVRISDAPAITITASDFTKLSRHSAVLTDHGKQIG